VFSTWEDKYRDNIEWLKGGYTFPVYREIEEKALKGILPIQKKYGLNIDFVGPEDPGGGPRDQPQKAL
jgi:sarcosine oxidase, subunit beta